MPELIELIKSIPIFADLTDDDLEKLIKYSEKRKYPSGSIILYQGDTGNAIYLILKGQVKVVLTNEDGKEIILSTLEKNNYFGEMSIFDQEKRSATVVAKSNTEFLVISHEVLKNLIKGKPEIAFNLLAEMSRRLRATDEQVRSIAFSDVRRRVLKVLSDLLKESITEQKQPMDSISINRPAMKDVAAMCGTSRETVSRILNEFQKGKIIKLTKDKISINSKDIHYFEF